MLYSANQLLNKTLLLNRSVKVYKVSDINKLGDNAKPVFDLQKGKSFILYSFLLPTAEKIGDYGIKYAKRSDPYFVYKDGENFFAIAVIGDGRFSLKALKDQGALTVKEQAEQSEQDSKEWYEKIFSGFGSIAKPVKIVLVVSLVLVILSFVAPTIFRNLKKVNK